MIRGQRDGEGIWGRWNANGPGTARLFHEMNLGENFERVASVPTVDKYLASLLSVRSSFEEAKAKCGM
jgi:hypothetical protein